MSSEGVGSRESGVGEQDHSLLTADSRQPTALFIATVVAVAAIAFIQSYARWLDPIIDTGRDLYIPEQIARGAKLYRDIRYQYPPLAPYLLALITKAIGHSLAAYVAIGIAQSATIAASLWIALRRPLPAFAATLTFVATCFCGASTWGANFIFPYSYGATIGMTLLCIALAAFVHARHAIAIGALVLASWCKVEYAVAALVIVIVLTIARRITWRQLVAYCGAMIATIVAVAFYFRDTHWWSENVFAAWQHGARAKRFFEVVSGFADWRSQLLQIIAGIAGIAAILFLQRWRNWIAGIAIVIVALLLTGHSFFRAWAVLQWIALGWALLRDRESPLVIFAAFSVACTLRIPLNVAPAWYGFVLTVPTIALAAYTLFCYLPRRNTMAILWLAPFITNAGADLWQQRERYAEKRYAIVTPRGTFYDWNADRARTLNSVIGAVQGGTLAVIPEGITINYLANVPTTLSFHTFTPVEVDAPQTEDAIVRELTTNPPDRVLMVSRDLREYGARGFGVDYDVRAGALLRSQYHVENIWRSPRFNATLFTTKAQRTQREPPL
ncbi:MAG: hypothetical protein QOF63_293 [Thermoanaerobaculia bacterium]|nr:hypothetical protein [Thermoanaerobaculia bacterium]